MQYLRLVYLSDRVAKAMHHDERCPDAAAVCGFALRGLRCESSSFSARNGHGNGLITDGPFVETKEYRVSR